MYHPLPCLCNASTLRRDSAMHVMHAEVHMLSMCKYTSAHSSLVQGTCYASKVDASRPFVCLAPRVLSFLRSAEGAQPLGGLALQGHPPLQSKGFAPPFGPGFASLFPGGAPLCWGIATFGVEAQVGKRARARVLGKTGAGAPQKGVLRDLQRVHPPKGGVLRTWDPQNPKMDPL